MVVLFVNSQKFRIKKSLLRWSTLAVKAALIYRVLFLICFCSELVEGYNTDGPSPPMSDLGLSRLNGPGSAESAATSVLIFLSAVGREWWLG